MEPTEVVQSIDEPMERIEKLVTAADPATQGEVQEWRGYWVHASHKGPMELELFVTDDHQVIGSGVDEVGEFTIQGEELAAHVNWTKHYVNAHVLYYKGRKVSTKRIQGFWSYYVVVDSLCDLTKGEFLLERVDNDEEYAVASHHHDVIYWLQQGSCLNRLRNWIGFYEQFGQQYNMNTCFIFSPSGGIHGNGHDPIGYYTWCGTFLIGPIGRMEVALVKQYRNGHAVFYDGHIKDFASSELVMEGTWTIPGSCCGAFRLQST